MRMREARRRSILMNQLPIVNWSKLEEGRCPFCGNKLVVGFRNPRVMICKGIWHKKNKKSFVISIEKLEENYGFTPNQLNL